MTTRTVQFVASSGGFTWTAPPGVSALWLTMTGGGSGVSGAGDSFSFVGPGGGAGSAELCINRPIPVIPGTTYTITIGLGSAGTSYGVRPAFPTGSSFNGYNALGSGGFPGPFFSTGAAGAGGGVGGSSGGFGGGGFDQKGKRECCNFGGGSGGSYQSFYYQGFNEVEYTHHTGILGGMHAYAGSPMGNGGGPSGGVIWGANNGFDQDTTNTGGNPLYYGAGCGGTGAPSHGTTSGGKGSDGLVILMWIER